MSFQSILLAMFARLDGERSAKAVYHILRGKRSGQSLQDIEYYGLKPFYGLLPKLPAETLQQHVEELAAEKYIAVEDSLVYVTESGRQAAEQLVFRFNSFYYRGGEREFSRRLALCVQTLSYLRRGRTSFSPIQKELQIQQFVKDFLRGQMMPADMLAAAFLQELHELLVSSDLTDMQKDLFMLRLTGDGLTAYTWEQLAEFAEMPLETVQLLYLESLHIVLDEIHAKKLPFLSRLALGCRAELHLTHSAERTYALSRQGYSIEEIAAARNLKMSTIEDHFFEIAANAESFPFESFISNEEIAAVWRVIDQLQTKRLRLLKEQCSSLSYFQLRLAIIHGKQGSL